MYQFLISSFLFCADRDRHTNTHTHTHMVRHC